MAADLGTAGRDFAQRLGKIGTAVQRGRADTLRDMALAAKREHEDVIRRDTGDGRLSGVGRRGARVGARFDVQGSRATIKATGPLHFVAHPMSPHRIPKVRQRGRRRYAVIPGVGVRAWAQHPGTRGKDTWNKARRPASKKVTKVAQTKTANIVRRGFG